MAKLRQREGISARALEFTILTIARTNDTIGAKWIEIDQREKFWTVPAARVKGKKGARKRDHVVPLTDQALAVLENLPSKAITCSPAPMKGKACQIWPWPKRGLVAQKDVAFLHPSCADRYLAAMADPMVKIPERPDAHDETPKGEVDDTDEPDRCPSMTRDPIHDGRTRDPIQCAFTGGSWP
jgi:hypothetical protein